LSNKLEENVSKLEEKVLKLEEIVAKEEEKECLKKISDYFKFITPVCIDLSNQFEPVSLSLGDGIIKS
jgi:hypothetical protein